MTCIENGVKEEKGHNWPYEGARDVCWYCGGQLCWDSDFNYDEVFGEGEGIATYLHCTKCGATVLYSQRTDEEDEEKEDQ